MKHGIWYFGKVKLNHVMRLGTNPWTCFGSVLITTPLKSSRSNIYMQVYFNFISVMDSLSNGSLYTDNRWSLGVIREWQLPQPCRPLCRLFIRRQHECTRWIPIRHCLQNWLVSSWGWKHIIVQLMEYKPITKLWRM